MIRQSASKGTAPSAAYAIVNAVIWVGYVALILLAVQMLAFADSAAVAVTVVIAALAFRPLRRHASRAARQHFGHR